MKSEFVQIVKPSGKTLFRRLWIVAVNRSFIMPTCTNYNKKIQKHNTR